MALKCGIVGLPNVGKSTLFNCLSNAKAQSANFPFCTIEPNVGVITVPDDRLIQLEKLVKPQRVQATTIEIVDIAGLVKGAHKGEGLGNQFLGNIRETDAIIHVLRCFDDDNVVHVDGSVNPIRDKEIIDAELILKDIDTLQVQMDKIARVVKTGDKSAAKLFSMYENLMKHLLSGQSARSFSLEDSEIEDFNKLFLLTSKPILYVCNVDEASVSTGNKFTDLVKENVKNEKAEVLIIGAGIESEIAALERYEDRQEFLQDIGLSEPGVNKLITAAYSLLKLQTYFTAGVKEVRAWTIKKGFKAPQAAGVIHTDFEKGFIRAEVIKYKDFVALGSESACKEVGKMATEGKEYLVEDGDIMHFRFNV